MEHRQERLQGVAIDYEVENRVIHSQEEPPFSSNETLKSSAIVCCLIVKSSHSYPSPTGEYGQFVRSVELGTILWTNNGEVANYDEVAQDQFVQRLSSIGVDDIYHHLIASDILSYQLAEFSRNEDYFRNYQQGNFRKCMKIIANITRFHEEYYVDYFPCRLVPTAKSVIESLEVVEVESLDAAIRRENCTICLEGIHTERLALKLPCKHVFHEVCAVEWLQSSHFCPLCRFEMPVDE